jgi:hypothetical protein
MLYPLMLQLHFLFLFVTTINSNIFCYQILYNTQNDKTGTFYSYP